MLEPRRVAARAAAERLAEGLGEPRRRAGSATASAARRCPAAASRW